jgi:hypothetical protein
MNLQELMYILGQGENQYTEFKAEFPEQAHAIAKEMVAFANSGGGTLFMGVDDDGNPTGIDSPLKADERLANIAKTCNPSLWIDISRIQVTSNITVIYAEIPHSPICTYQGKVYIRVGTTSREAGGKEIERLSELLNPKYVQLEPDLENARSITKKNLRNKALWGYFGTFLIGFPLLLLAITSLTWVFFLAIPTIAIFCWFNGEAMYLYSKRPRSSEEASFVGQGNLMEDDGKGSYLIYRRTASCIYPCCKKGKIVLTNAPPREVSRLCKTFVGVCSIAGTDHSYYVNRIWVATPDKFDWRSPNAT